jgi:hypothetical protein
MWTVCLRASLISPPLPRPVSLADALREAIRESGLSYSRLAQLAKLNSGMISHFMTGSRDMTLGVASRLCAVLGYELTKVGETVTKPLAAPPKTNRDPKGRRPASVVKRGRGRRVDLEVKEEAVQSEPRSAVGSEREKVASTPPKGSPPPTGRALANRRSRQNKG